MQIGWTSSGDYLHIETRCQPSRIYRSIKIFNDLLLQPKSGSEAYKLCSQVLSQAIGKNLKFSISNFRVTPTVTFSSLMLTAKPNDDVDIKPYRRRIKNILDMPTPKIKEDTLSLRGSWGP